MILLRDVSYNGWQGGVNLHYILNNAIIMSEEKTQEKQSFTKKWGSSTKKTKALFKPEDFDIYCDRNSGMTFIYHSPELACSLDYMEYNPENQRVTVFTKDGQKLDLGVKIQWLIRPYFAKPQYLYVIRTKDGQAVDGYEVELRIKKEDETQILN